MFMLEKRETLIGLFTFLNSEILSVLIYACFALLLVDPGQTK